MPRKVKCSKCDKVCFSKSELPLCSVCSYEKRTKHRCIATYKRYHSMLKKYNVDESGFNALWSAFKGKCGICNKNLKMPELRRGQCPESACLDHDHITGNIRGLLCNSCNKGIGLLKDSTEILLKDYYWVGGK